MFQINKNVIFRKEFDGSGILFQSDSGKSFILNPMSVIIWQLLPEAASMDDLLTQLRDRTNFPPEGEKETKLFIENLASNGLIQLR